jgi:hypothetical protein
MRPEKLIGDPERRQRQRRRALATCAVEKGKPLVVPETQAK